MVTGRQVLAVLSGLTLVCACDQIFSIHDQTLGPEGGHDAATRDATRDAVSSDVGHDAGHDAGTAHDTGTDRSTPPDVGTGDAFVAPIVTAITAGAFHTCALLADGTVECWGFNDHGQLGNGSTTNQVNPVKVETLVPATAITAGNLFTCAMGRSMGTGLGPYVYCWGNNSFGQLGNGMTSTGSVVPVQVENVNGAIAISAGLYHACAIVQGGTVWCWGANSYGQLGTGTATDAGAAMAVQASVISNATAIACANDYTCALVGGGAVDCWGFNGEGQLGNGSMMTSVPTPQLVSLPAATALTAANDHTCAVISGGVKCWGQDSNGELGNGMAVNTGTPVAVTGLTAVTSLVAGYYHTCAILPGQVVDCWGDNNHGQLGLGSYTGYEIPKPVPGLGNVTALTAGEYHTCALLSDGTVKCWGSNANGQIGIGTTSDAGVTSPAAVVW